MEKDQLERIIDMIDDEIKEAMPKYLNFLKVYDNDSIPVEERRKAVDDLKFSIESLMVTIIEIKKMLPPGERAEAKNGKQPESINANTFILNCARFNLTVSEIKIVELIAKGFSYKAIGDKLFISGKTVSSHIQNIYEKVGVKRQTELLKRLEHSPSKP